MPCAARDLGGLITWAADKTGASRLELGVNVAPAVHRELRIAICLEELTLIAPKLFMFSCLLSVPRIRCTTFSHSGPAQHSIRLLLETNLGKTLAAA